MRVGVYRLRAWVQPEWIGPQMCLLHVGTNAVLFATGGLLTARFIRSLVALDELNRMLKARMAGRECALVENSLQVGWTQHVRRQLRQQRLADRPLGCAIWTQIDADDGVGRAGALRL